MHYKDILGSIVRVGYRIPGPAFHLENQQNTYLLLHVVHSTLHVSVFLIRDDRLAKVGQQVTSYVVHESESDDTANHLQHEGQGNHHTELSSRRAEKEREMDVIQTLKASTGRKRVGSKIRTMGLYSGI